MKHKTDNSNDACTDFLEKLDRWLAFELDADHSHGMQAHHDVCPACRLETRLARDIDVAMMTLPAKVRPALQAPAIQGPGLRNLVSRLLATWRQPLVFVPAFAALLVTIVAFQLRIADAPAGVVVINGEEYTQEDVMQAAKDLEIALHYLDKYGSYPARVVSAELQNSHLPLPPPQASGNTPAI